jgi:Ribosomal protein L10
MSKAVKELVMRDYKERLGDLEDAMVISLRGVDAISTTKIRSKLAEKEIRVTVIRNKLFTQAFSDSKLAGLAPVLKGGSAVAYGGQSVVEVAREIVALLKEHPGIELKGAVLDGELFEGEKGVERLSKLPTRDEAIAQDVTLILSPGRKLLGAIKGPGSAVVGLIKAIEAKLEKGEEIAKVG